MKRFFSKEFCLWLVSPHDGTVRKIRLSSGKIILAVVFTLFFAGSFVFVAGDYTRVQLLRAKHYFNFKRLNNERGSLVSHNQDLRIKVKGLEQEKQRVLSFEQDVRQRLSELNSVLESAAELGIVPSEGQHSRDATALGGAETECDPTYDSCVKSSAAEYTPSAFHPLADEEDLISQLERSIQLTSQIPIGLPGRGFVSSIYGPRRSPFTGKWKNHQGVDFALPHGSAVFATADGIVKSVKRTSTYGLKIDMQHGSSVVTRFAHLSKAKVKAGQKICRGQEIGLVGSTGRSTGPHLHYEIRVNGKSVDPQLLFNLSKKIQKLA